MFHRTELIGKVWKDAELRHISTGTAVATFSVLVAEKIGDTEQKTWYRVQAWGKLAEVCAKYVKTGMSVFVDGRIKESSYEKDGVKHYKWELVANTVKFLSFAKAGAVQTDASLTQDGHIEYSVGISAPPEANDDVPF